MARLFFHSVGMTGKFNCHSDISLIYFRKLMKNIVCRITSFVFFCFFAGMGFPLIASAQDWSVAPIKLQFSGGTTTGVITVSNDSAAKISYQLNAFEWTQDKDGKDVYSETPDLVFYPKVMSVEPKDQKIIRVGMKIARGASEKTYRLFIEDITRPPGTTGTNVVFAIRFGVPIFFKPVKEDVKGNLEALTMQKGVLVIPVRNSGNSHFIVQKVTIHGLNPRNETIFSKELPGWYVLNHTLKKYTMEIPRESCQKISKIGIEVKTEQFTLKDSLNVQKAMCLR